MEHGQRITEGCFIIFHSKDRLVSICGPLDENGAPPASCMSWDTGDKRAIAEFITSKNDFFNFADIIAQTHNLTVELAELGQHTELGNTVFKFVKEKK